MRTRFRDFRYTRPFWGALYVLLAGLIIAWLPLGPVADVVRAGMGGVAGVLLGVLILAMGALILLFRSQRRIAAVAAIVLGIVSYPVTNLGGFFAGLLLAVFGGAMALAWTDDKPRTSSRRSEGIES